MKKLIISFIISLTLISFTRCNDNENMEPHPLRKVTLRSSTPEELYIGSLTGNKDGAVEGLMLEKYRDQYHERIPFNDITNMFNLSSITFTELSDSVEIKGYVNYDYREESYFNVYYIQTELAKFKYKFENGSLMINVNQNKEEKPEWMILGYGDKNKIEVYLDSKIMRSGLILGADGSYTNGMGSSFTSHRSINPDEALANIKNHKWDIFFDEISTMWTRIPTITSWAERWGSVESLKSPSYDNNYMGVSWRIIKITYTISEE